MESLFKPVRVRDSGSGQETTRETTGGKQKRKLLKTSVSFKEEKNKAQNWLQRQFSRQMTEDIEIENAAAVGAMAYAISSLEEPRSSHRRKSSNSHETSATKSPAERSPTISIQGPGSSSKRFAGQRSMRRSDTDEKLPQITIRPAPSFKESLTQEDKPLSDTGTEITEPKPHKPVLKPPPPPPEPEPPTPRPWRDTPKRYPPPESRPAPRPMETKISTPKMTQSGATTEADAWEEAQLAKIIERYQKLHDTIVDWESKKMEKARRKLQKAESDLGRDRTRALEKFRGDMDYINRIADGARVQAKDRQINEMLKVQAKANTIRATGKVPKPRSCFCF